MKNNSSSESSVQVQVQLQVQLHGLGSSSESDCSSASSCCTTLEVSAPSSEGSLFFIGDLFLVLPEGDFDFDGVFVLSFGGGSLGFFFLSLAFFWHTLVM